MKVKVKVKVRGIVFTDRVSLLTNPAQCPNQHCHPSEKEVCDVAMIEILVDTL